MAPASGLRHNVAAMPEPSAARRAVILLMATFTVGTYVLTVTIANVSLPQMQGTFAATQDQIAWILTANLVATAVVTPMSGWLAVRFGRRRVMIWCAFTFGLVSILCGLAQSLPELVFYRAIQGGAGAPLLPLSQAILLEAYPREQHGRATVIWSIGVTMGSIISPWLGGYASEAFSWRWVFLMIAPLVVINFIAIWFVITADDRDRDRAKPQFDWTGFLALAIAVAALQLLLDRGQRQDWFESTEIILEACAAVVALYLFIVHVLTTDHPFLNPRLLLDRNYAVGLILAFAFGLLYFTTLVLQPSMLQDLKGYPDSMIGILQASRGVGLLAGALLLLFWFGRFDPRFNLCLGFIMQGIAGLAMAQFDVNMTTWDVAWTTMLQGFGLGLIWAPITQLTFATLEARYLPEATSVFHLLRNIGSSVHISITVAMVIRMTRVNYAELSTFINPFNEAMSYANVRGGWDPQSAAGLARLSGEIQRQAAMIGYIDAYYAYAALAALVLPLIILAKRPPRPAAS